jgi:hypothetical protein
MPIRATLFTGLPPLGDPVRTNGIPLESSIPEEYSAAQAFWRDGRIREVPTAILDMRNSLGEEKPVN